MNYFLTKSDLYCRDHDVTDFIVNKQRSFKILILHVVGKVI